MKKKTKRTIEISIKTDERLVMKQRRNVTRMWCPECRANVEVITLAEVSDRAGVLQRENMLRQMHVLETPEELFVCIDSLR